MKKTKGSGGFEPELAADGLFDLFARAAIILRQLVYRFPSFVALGYHRRRNSRPSQHWPPIGNVRIDDHDFGFIQVAFASEGIKPNRRSGLIVFDAVEVSFQKFAKGDLTALRDIDQSAELFNEQIDPIRSESLFGQRMARSEMFPKIMNRFADLAQRNLMMPSNRVQYVRFDQIDERKTGARVVGQLNDGPKKLGTGTGRILSTGDPRPQRRSRDR